MKTLPTKTFFPDSIQKITDKNRKSCISRDCYVYKLENISSPRGNLKTQESKLRFEYHRVEEVISSSNGSTFKGCLQKKHFSKVQKFPKTLILMTAYWWDWKWKLNYLHNFFSLSHWICWLCSRCQKLQLKFKRALRILQKLHTKNVQVWMKFSQLENCTIELVSILSRLSQIFWNIGIFLDSWKTAWQWLTSKKAPNLYSFNMAPTQFSLC